MKALGMIEVYGYLAAVEALDSALKAANVKLLNVTRVQGGLVSVLVTGEVGAVRASIDAAAAAADRVGQVISVHIIPRPADAIGQMLGADPVGFGSPTPPAGPKTPPEPSPEPEPEPQPEPEPTPELAPEPIPELEPKEDEPTPEGEDTSSETGQLDLGSMTEEAMQGMTVAGLRNVARGLEITTMTRKEIRFAKKEVLIAAILAFQAET